MKWMGHREREEGKERKEEWIGLQRRECTVRAGEGCGPLYEAFHLYILFLTNSMRQNSTEHAHTHTRTHTC